MLSVPAFAHGFLAVKVGVSALMAVPPVTTQCATPTTVSLAESPNVSPRKMRQVTASVLGTQPQVLVVDATECRSQCVQRLFTQTVNGTLQMAVLASRWGPPLLRFVTRNCRIALVMKEKSALQTLQTKLLVNVLYQAPGLCGGSEIKTRELQHHLPLFRLSLQHRCQSMRFQTKNYLSRTANHHQIVAVQKID